MVWHGPLIPNPYKPIVAPLEAALKMGAHSSEPFKEAKGHSGGPWEHPWITDVNLA